MKPSAPGSGEPAFWMKLKRFRAWLVDYAVALGSDDVDRVIEEFDRIFPEVTR